MGGDEHRPYTRSSQINSTDSQGLLSAKQKVGPDTNDQDQQHAEHHLFMLAHAGHLLALLHRAHQRHRDSLLPACNHYTLFLPPRILLRTDSWFKGPLRQEKAAVYWP